MGVIYEVQLELRTEILERFRNWISPHMKEVVKAGGFSKARAFELDDSPNPTFVVQYEISDRQKLENYLKNHAPRLREEAIELFGDQFKASRRILNQTVEVPSC